MPPPASESSPLLPSTTSTYYNEHVGSGSRIGRFFKAEGQPGWIESFKWFLFTSYFNVLLVFVPLSVVAHHLNWDAALRFSFSFLAIMPLAKLLGDSTEQMSFSLGQTLAGLLNASFGNAVEIIVGVAALLQDEIRIVQTSMLGSILSNILLVLGCSFVAAGYKRSESKFKVTAAQASSSLMTLSCITLVIPAAYQSTLEDKSNQKGLLIISRGTAVVFLLIYCTYIYFQLKSHAYLFDPSREEECECNCPCGKAGLASSHHGSITCHSHSSSTSVLIQQQHDASCIAAARGVPVPVTLAPEIAAREMARRGLSPQRAQGGSESEEEEEEEVARMSVVAAATALLSVTLITSFCADYLVSSIEEFAERYHVPKTFIGLILLPIVANAAEHVTSVWMAMKDQMELTITICVGSSIQIASFVIPLLVVVGWISGHELTLFFAHFETIILFASVLLVNTLIQDGKSNYMEGLMLLALYFVISLAFWVS